MRDLPVFHARRLDDAVAGAKLDLAHILVVEANPALEDVDHLEAEFVAVPFRLGVLAGHGADDVRAEAAAGGAADTEVAIGEEGAQPRVELRVGGSVDGGRHGVFPPWPGYPARMKLPPQAALLLDFDGTLVEIAATPDAVVVPPELPGLLLRVAARLDGALAIVSGRPIRDLERFLPVPIALAGEHGAVLRIDPAAPPEVVALPRAPGAWRDAAASLVAAHPGALLEEKTHGFVVHFRGAPAAGDPARALLEGFLAGDDSFTLLPAHRAWEIRPVGASKATAVRALMARAPFAGRVPVFVGDDVTDEAGMAAAREFGGEGWRLQEVFGTPGGLRGWLGGQ